MSYLSNRTILEKAVGALQGSISDLKAATSTLQRDRRGFAPAEQGGGGGTAANDADLRKRLKGANQFWKSDVLSLRAKGEYLYAGEVPQDLSRVQMVYVPKKVNAGYEGEYSFHREGTDIKTGQPSRQFRILSDKDDEQSIWMRADGKITWD